MHEQKRRQFLWTGMAAAAGLVHARTAGAIEPIRRNGRPQLRLSLAAYSFNRQLDRRRGQQPMMTLDDFIDFAAGQPFDAVELTAYYFAETTPVYLAHLKGKCTRLGLDVSGTAIGNNFCRRDPAQHRQEVETTKRWIEHTSRLGGKTLRIFAGNLERGDTEERARRQCIEAMQEACEHAAQFGVILALENHGGITAEVEQLLELVRGVRSDWFGVNLDTGNFRTRDPYADLERLAPYAVVAQVKTEIQRMGQNKEEADLPRLLQMLRAVNYRGYVALEYEASADPREAIPRYARQLRALCG
jgi:sugar phosphate isomerase/epimerase